jgi:hypothetical protein
MRADMPDAAASRKRQIQITPRPFRGAGAFRIRLTNGRYPLLRVWARLSGLGGPEGSRLVQRLAWRARRGIWPMGEVCPAHRCGNRVKLIRGRRRGRFDSKPPSRFQAVARKRRGQPHAMDAFRSGKPGSHHLSPTFLPRSGAPAAVRHHRGLRLTRCASFTDSIIGVKSAVTDSAASPSIRCAGGLSAGTSCLLRCVHPELRGQLELFKNI